MIWRPRRPSSSVAARRGAIAIALITLVALGLRVYDLGEYPTGLHGDEGIAGMEAARAWDERGIGVYSPLAAGQPTGPLYLFAVPVKLLGNTIVAVRIVPALLGTLTVVALYLVVRRSFGEVAGLAAAAVLAVMSWHIHYARIGFPLEAWPLVVVLGAGALAEAVRTRDWRWWAAAGAFAASGIYVYNAHPAFLGLMGGVALGWILFAPKWSFQERAFAGLASAWAGVLVLVPMGWYALGNWEEYSAHFDRDSRLDRPEWADASAAGRLEFLYNGYIDWWERFLRGGQPDFVDAIGITPVVPGLLMVVAYAGICVGLLRYVRSPLMQLGVLTLALLPFASVLTEEAFARRTFAMAPFLAMFAGIGVGELVRWGRSQGRETLVGVGVVVAVVWAGVAWQNLYNYFEVTRNDPLQPWVFVDDFTQASVFMDALPADRYVLFYSERWSLDYETRQYLAPGVRGENRSEQFGQPGFGFNPALGRPVFVFVGGYRAMVEEVEALYPGGRVTVGRAGATGPTFIAYEPP